ncbi:MAG: Ig-like domain-containing protein [Anaerolineae bacterium]|nr:Ig-like domain-containing protein [Anaerolineae bacterium]
MQTRHIFWIGIVLILLGSMYAVTQALAPRVVGVYPEADSVNLPADTGISVEFSRPMDEDSVLENISILPQVEGEFIWQENTLWFVPEEDWPRGEQIIVSLQRAAKSSWGIALREETVWQFKVRREMLAYLWPLGTDAQIYLIEPVTGEAEKLTDSQGVLSYDIGSRGEGFYYAAYNQQSGSDLFYVQRRQGNAGLVYSCGQALCDAVTLSPDEERLAFTRTRENAGQEIWTLNLETGEAHRVSRAGHDTRLPLWTPQGKLSFYDISDERFIVLDLTSGDIQRILNETGEAGAWDLSGDIFVTPEFSVVTTDILRGPSGERSNQPVDEASLEPVQVAISHLIAYDLSSNQRIDLTRTEMIQDYTPTFSPNGFWLVFGRKFLDESRWTPGRQVWLMRADGSEARVLTDAPQYKYTAFAWHPNGRQLAVVRFNTITLTSPPEIWMIDVRSGEQFRLLIDAFAPRWAP